MITNKQIFAMFFEEIYSVLSEIENYIGELFEFENQSKDTQPIENELAELDNYLSTIKDKIIQKFSEKEETEEEIIVKDVKTQIKNCEEIELIDESDIQSFKAIFSDVENEINTLFETNDRSMQKILNGSEKENVYSSLSVIKQQISQFEMNDSDNNIDYLKINLASQINQLNNNLYYNSGTRVSNRYVDKVKKTLDEIEHAIVSNRNVDEVIDEYAKLQECVADFKTYYARWGDV